VLRAVALALGAAVLLLIAVLVHHALDATRGVPVEAITSGASARGLPSPADTAFGRVIASLGEASLATDGGVEILIDGEETFGRLFGDLRSARASITFQMYYCDHGHVADTLASILAERARSGVRVRFLADGFGCRTFPSRHGRTLREAGAEVAVLRPVRWYTLHKAQHRSHVRIIVIDGFVGYTGGFGADDRWLDGDASGRGWRETNVRFTGAVVRQAQAAFVKAWADATGQLVADPDLFRAAAHHDVAPVANDSSIADDGLEADAAREPVPEGHREVPAAIQFAGPGVGTTPFERLVVVSVAAARERILITNPYFVPNALLRKLLAEAVGRGVEVRVLTAGSRTDVPSTLFASRGYYGELLQAGVRIHEYQPTMVHAKTFVIDGTWTSIGTMNLDNRSMRLNDEVNLLVHDGAVGAEMESIFERDLDRSVEITYALYEGRSWRQRLFERAARMIAPLL
jgi:cardiolipin synthase A/B